MPMISCKCSFTAYNDFLLFRVQGPHCSSAQGQFKVGATEPQAPKDRTCRHAFRVEGSRCFYARLAAAATGAAGAARGPGGQGLCGDAAARAGGGQRRLTDGGPQVEAQPAPAAAGLNKWQFFNQSSFLKAFN